MHPYSDRVFLKIVKESLLAHWDIIHLFPLGVPKLFFNSPQFGTFSYIFNVRVIVNILDITKGI